MHLYLDQVQSKDLLLHFLGCLYGNPMRDSSQLIEKKGYYYENIDHTLCGVLPGLGNLWQLVVELLSCVAWLKWGLVCARFIEHCLYAEEVERALFKEPAVRAKTACPRGFIPRLEEIPRLPFVR